MSKKYFTTYQCNYCHRKWKEAKDNTAIMDSFSGANRFCSNGCAVAFENKIQAEKSRIEVERQEIELKRNNNLAKIVENSTKTFEIFDESRQNVWAQIQEKNDFNDKDIHYYTSTKKSSLFMKTIKALVVICFVFIVLDVFIS